MTDRVEEFKQREQMNHESVDEFNTLPGGYVKFQN